MKALTVWRLLWIKVLKTNWKLDFELILGVVSFECCGGVEEFTFNIVDVVESSLSVLSYAT